MSQKIRVGNVYYHTEEESEVVVVHRDDYNNVWYRGVISRDNAGVISSSEWIGEQPYSEFLGDTSTEDYPEDWSDMAAAVRKRDEYTAQCCGLHQDDHDGKLPVHHIVPLGCGGTNTFRNLITLCEKHHGRIHGGVI